MWKCLQVAVAALFFFANIHWGWMDNGYVAGANAAFLALFVTWLVSRGIEARRYGLWSTLPDGRTFMRVSGAVVLAVSMIATIGVVFVFAELWLKAR